jgi:hypothetical protein
MTSAVFIVDHFKLSEQLPGVGEESCFLTVKGKFHFYFKSEFLLRMKIAFVQTSLADINIFLSYVLLHWVVCTAFLWMSLKLCVKSIGQKYELGRFEIRGDSQNTSEVFGFLHALCLVPNEGKSKSNLISE